MNDGANIRFVNAHAEGIGTNDHPDLIVDPGFLFAVPLSL